MKTKSLLKSLLMGLCFSAVISGPKELLAQDVVDVGPHTIVVTTDIDSSLEEVWQVMIDFKNYDQWNGWYRLEGEASEGSVIKAFSYSGEHLDLEVTKLGDHTICWTDVTWFTYLGLGGWRCRVVWASPDGKGVKFTNHFEFTGPFRFLLELKAKEFLLNGMIQENQDLKAFVERR